ncbi:head GIN domain-containing protein [Flagellimonas meishanensis]|uniref:head GIN domain-containing protein n=1 Tax=Flagellimonas meishanensis TaxID=2873264 RepID=UPI001CA6D880|nr:head GIN domain-containing protein [[Muricauda] meishanensis]
MKSITLLFTVLSIQLLAAQETEIIKNLEKFTEIKVFDGISLQLIKSNENKAVISGANTDKVAVVNNEGVLKIRMELDKMFSGYRTYIDVYHKEDLKVIDVNEDARISSDQTYVLDVLDLRAQEGGEIELNCQVDQLLIKAVSGGEITVSGFANTQDIIINTGGTYNGKTFKTKYTTIDVSAGGNAEIYATDYVKANVKAGGGVLVHGNPAKMDEKKVFGGKIKRMD